MLLLPRAAWSSARTSCYSCRRLTIILHVPLCLCSIGINGCSLKTEDNLQVMAAVPLDRLLLETDCPWCEIRPSHAGELLLPHCGCLGLGRTPLLHHAWAPWAGQ